MKIGLISFRIAGNDGVSLEAERWATVLEKMGHRVVFIAGELDRRGILLPELHFNHPAIVKIYEKVVGSHGTFEEIEKDIFTLAGPLEGQLREILRKEEIEQLIIANVFSLPMHFPLTVALTRLIEEKQILTVARHHDFWWERERFNNSTMFQFFAKYFPPENPKIKHVTLNSLAQEKLLSKKKINSLIIGDSFDFKSKLNQIDNFSQSWRKDFQIKKEEIVFLQATRIVPRKQIELSLELIKRLKNPQIVFILAGASGDEGDEYEEKIRQIIRKEKIRAKFIGHRVNSFRKIKEGKKIYTLWDCFANADFITYFSEVEGFGNQFTEAVYFKKPIFINRYPVFKSDIEPLGFRVIAVDGKITDKTVAQANNLLTNSEEIQKMVDYNFKLGEKYFSYQALRKKLEKLGF